MISRGGLNWNNKNGTKTKVSWSHISCLIGRLYEIWRKETDQTCSLISFYLFFHIYLQSLSVKTTEVRGYSWYQKQNNAESLSSFFQNQSNSQRRKKWHRETKGQRQLSPFCRRQRLKFRKGICVSKSLRIAFLSAYRFKHI